MKILKIFFFVIHVRSRDQTTVQHLIYLPSDALDQSINPIDVWKFLYRAGALHFVIFFCFARYLFFFLHTTNVEMAYYNVLNYSQHVNRYRINDFSLTKLIIDIDYQAFFLCNIECLDTWIHKNVSDAYQQCGSGVCFCC